MDPFSKQQACAFPLSGGPRFRHILKVRGERSWPTWCTSECATAPQICFQCDGRSDSRVCRRSERYQSAVQGRTNIEYYLDEALRGTPGRRILKKNAKNQIEGEKEIIQPKPGANVYLTIDSRIQYIVERALRNVGRGACVVVDPNNGHILAMASVPSFDPNKFIPSISAQDWA